MNRLVARISLLAALVALTSIATVGASPQSGKKKLEPGDKAPNLDGITDWVQGEKPDLSDGVVVVEFWATWCVPCKRVIPHLNKMHKSYSRAGLKLVGVAADEGRPKYEDNLKQVKDFVKGKGDGMSYIVAVDNLLDAKRAWMEAAGIEGIPATFVVGRGGRVLWIGRPYSEDFERVVILALKNKYDPILTPKAFDGLAAAKRAAALRNWREAYHHIDEFVKVDPPLFGWMVIDRYKMTLEQEQDPEAAKQYLKSMLPGIANDPYSLEEVVRGICKDPAITKRDLDTALIYAEQTKKAVGGNQALGISAVAMVMATKGDLNKAVELQTSAWLAAVPDEKPEYKRVLEEYQKMLARRDQAKAFAGE